MKKIVIAGGTGFLGTCLQKYYSGKDVQVIVLTRRPTRIRNNIQYIHWDGKTIDSLQSAIEGVDVVINLNGKSVDCRYTERNKKLIYSTRLDATAAIGKAIQSCDSPPAVWINASSATIYRHSLDKEMDEYTGEFGSGFSVDVCQKWEGTCNEFVTPRTRKVLIRTGIVLGKTGNALKALKRLVKLGLGGKQGPGNQYCSWLHENDFVKIIDHIVNQENMRGAYNVTAPSPIANTQLMKTLRKVLNIPFGLPLPKWFLEFGALLIDTETELILKSRRVVPKRLLEEGYRFEFATIDAALEDLLIGEKKKKFRLQSLVPRTLFLT